MPQQDRSHPRLTLQLRWRRFKPDAPLDMAARMRLPLALAIAALRFWLSRLGAETPGEEVIGQGSKDPAEFEVLFPLRACAL